MRRYAATSASSAATSIRRAPSRAVSSSKDRPSPSSAVALLTTFTMVPPPSRRVAEGGGRSGGRIRRRGHGLHDRRVARGGCPPRAPTDPYVRDYRIRLFRAGTRCEPVHTVSHPLTLPAGVSVRCVPSPMSRASFPPTIPTPAPPSLHGVLGVSSPAFQVLRDAPTPCLHP